MSSSLPQILSDSRNGKIHSIFANSFNIVFDDELVNINRKENQLSSFGINISGREMDAILASIAIGDLVKIHNAALRIYPTYGSVLEIETSGLEILDLSLRPVRVTALRLGVIRSVLELPGIYEHIGLARTHEEQKNLDDLVSSNPISPVFLSACRYLIGRGEGLTPSGDDILMGFFMMQNLFSFRFELDESMLVFIRQKTTDISFAYLKSLNNGYVSEYYQDFCQAASQDNLNGLKMSVEKIKSIGSTSGFDSLLGMNLGVRRISEGLGYSYSVDK